MIEEIFKKFNKCYLCHQTLYLKSDEIRCQYCLSDIDSLYLVWVDKEFYWLSSSNKKFLLHCDRNRTLIYELSYKPKSSKLLINCDFNLEINYNQNNFSIYIDNTIKKLLKLNLYS